MNELHLCIHSVYLSLCPNREHCLAVKELYCHKEWPVLEVRSSVQPGLYGSGSEFQTPSLPLPNCQTLSSLRTDADACTHVPFVGEISLTEALRRMLVFQ